MANRCEDYPACGHTDGLPCDWVAPDYRNPRIAAVYHIGCDHNAGVCDYLPDDDDDEGDGDYDDTTGCEHPGVFATDKPTTHCYYCDQDVPRRYL
jgi:hypothetical protein